MLSFRGSGTVVLGQWSSGKHLQAENVLSFDDEGIRYRGVLEDSHLRGLMSRITEQRNRGLASRTEIVAWLVEHPTEAGQAQRVRPPLAHSVIVSDRDAPIESPLANDPRVAHVG